jgi:hypothetical protein
MILLPRNRHVNLLDSIHDYCYPKNSHQAIPRKLSAAPYGWAKLIIESKIKLEEGNEMKGLECLQKYGAILVFSLSAMVLAGLPGLVQAAAPEASTLADLPLPAQAAISAALGRDDAAFRIYRDGDGYGAENRGHGLSVRWTGSGMEVLAGSGSFGLTLKGLGYGDSRAVEGVIAPQADGNRVEYLRGVLTEWYVNGPLGVEQGFTLADRPVGDGSGPLTLALAVTGGMGLILDSSAAGLTLSSPEGGPALRYSGLIAVDGAGRELPSWMEVNGKEVLLRVDDSGATYPVMVDPYVQRAKLTASDGATNDHLGLSVSISGDTVVAGADGAAVGGNESQGAAYVFQSLMPPVPAMSHWGLFVFGLFIALGTFWVMRRRKIIS